MKKQIAVYGVAICLFLLAGCAGEDPGPQSTIPGVTSRPEGALLPESSSQPEEAGVSSGQKDQGEEPVVEKLQIQANGHTFTAVLEDNSSARALKDLLAGGPLTVSMEDYGNFEKVGPLGTALPRNDTQITTGPGDVILYQGDKITIYYDVNSWSFTRLATIENATGKALKEALGSGEVTVTFSLVSQ